MSSSLLSEYAAHNSLQMSSSRYLTDVTLVSEDAAHNSLQMSSSRDLTDVTLMCEGYDGLDDHNVCEESITSQLLLKNIDKFKMQCEGGRL